VKISAIGFDFDHTLGIDNKLERVAFLRLLEAACAQGSRYLGTLAQEIERIDALLAKQRSGACTIEHAVESFVREHGGSNSREYPERYKGLAMEMVSAFVIPQPGVREALAGLRARKLPYAILTNGWSPLQQRKAARVQFDGPVVVSADIGVQKPEAAAFDALARVLGAPANEIAFVGDTPASDVAGAIAAGMFGIWFDAEGVEYPKDVPAPSAVIHSLAELLSVV
jgi:HAD superfamily hydrolase (TIGR01509 family)